jgi:phosphotransacetylase
MNKLSQHIEACRDMPAIRTAVVHPVQANVLEAVVDAVKAGLIIPILIGPLAKIESAALEAGIDLSRWEILNTEHSDAAAAKAVQLAAAGKVDAIMKGSLHTDELMAAIVPASSGLRTKYRISHAYVMDVPSYHKPLIVTDAAINIAPSAADKADICQNAIALWRILYGEDRKPKVAILAVYHGVSDQPPHGHYTYNNPAKSSSCSLTVSIRASSLTGKSCVIPKFFSKSRGNNPYGLICEWNSKFSARSSSDVKTFFHSGLDKTF